MDIDGPDRSQPARQVAHPITLSGAAAVYHRPPPRLGEHTAEVLAWLTPGV
ncbi:hypothetical protein [Micromonospora inositola]|uniref:hypothetical protein n=1 Tax=Micromonospora inositola TaxID=47865 RepID=UPI0012FD0729|nr:hypothetical protein [Micromonospora inositola]